LFVVGDDNPGVGSFPAKDHVAAALTSEHKAAAFQGSADVSARQVGGEFGHVWRCLVTRPRLR
jgi:hypothetical protein